MDAYNEATAVAEALAAARGEIDRQEELWGLQRHPLIGLDDKAYDGTDMAEYDRDHMRYACADRAEHWKKTNDKRVSVGVLGWDGILLEEVYEALEAVDLEDQVTELLQVAAVAINAAISLRRQAAEDSL
jgi:hypothetical protein